MRVNVLLDDVTRDLCIDPAVVGFVVREAKGNEEAYRRPTKGNSLYRNSGNGKFEETGPQQAVEMGRWAWGSGGFDWDLDGWKSFASDPEVPPILQEAGHKGRPQVPELSGHYEA